MRVVFVQPILTHYRKSIIQKLLTQDKFEAFFISSKKYLRNTPYDFDHKRVFDNHKYFHFQLLNHRFFWLKGSIKSLRNINPDIIILTGYDPHMIHSQIIFLFYRIFTSKKVLWWSHGSSGTQGRVGKWIRSFYYKTSNGILAYSKKSKDNLISMGGKKEKIKVINNSIPLDDYGFLNTPVLEIKQEQKQTNEIRIICVGKLNFIKRLDILIDAIQILKEKNIKIRCFIVGIGDEETNLKHKINEFHLENEIRMLGPLFGKDLNDLFLNSDIYVIPDGVGLSIVHAFSYGLPVITTNRKGNHGPEVELLVENENGAFFNDYDVNDLANQIISWSNKTKEGRKEIAENCISSIYKHGYLPEIMIDNISELVNDISNK